LLGTKTDVLCNKNSDALQIDLTGFLFSFLFTYVRKTLAAALIGLSGPDLFLLVLPHPDKKTNRAALRGFHGLLLVLVGNLYYFRGSNPA